MKPFFVVKASGEKELFSLKKYQVSLRRSGCSDEAILEILKKIKPVLKDGITTKRIYSETAKLLKCRNHGSASRYNLKRGILDFGPSGYPFEKFVASLFKRQGYKVSIDKIVNGKCVAHEVDVIATKGNTRAMIECKFHNKQKYSSNVKTSLYIKARFDDINLGLKLRGKEKERFNECWIVTNTRFTSRAIKYAECVGIKVLSWRYPRKGGFAEIVDRLGMIPISCLTILNKKDVNMLLKNEIVVCEDVFNNLDVLKRLKFSERKINGVIDECKNIMPK
jgi:hypothetical protein